MDAPHPQLKPLGLAWIIWSALTGLTGVAVALLGAGMGVAFTKLPDSHSGEPAPWWVAWIFGSVGVLIGAGLIITGLAGVAVGYGVRKGWTWALIGALVLGVLHIANMPVGTILGVWTIYVIASHWMKRDDLIGGS